MRCGHPSRLLLVLRAKRGKTYVVKELCRNNVLPLMIKAVACTQQAVAMTHGGGR